MPPGAPEAKLNIEKTNFIINMLANKPIEVSKLKQAITLCPPPKTIGKHRPKTQAKINGIMGFVLVFKKYKLE